MSTKSNGQSSSCIVPGSSAELIHNAYRRLTYEQLRLFCSIRSLSSTGSDIDLASRLADHDLNLYGITTPSPSPSATEYSQANGAHAPSVIEAPKTSSRPRLGTNASTHQVRQRRLPPLPVELMAEIMDHIGDWELTKAVGLPTSLEQRPQYWTRASPTDNALLTGYLPLLVSSQPSLNPPTSIGARLTIRFAYTHILTYLFLNHRSLFRKMYKHDLILLVASEFGRVEVLEWWAGMRKEYPNDFVVSEIKSIKYAIDGASKAGQVGSLDWWLKSSSLPFEFTEAALEHASAKNQLHVLDWWRSHAENIQLKVGRVMDTASAAGHVSALQWWAHSGLDYTYDKQAMYHASCHGRVEVLEWWLNSGLQLFYDQEVLVGATRHNKPESLEWWDQSRLKVQYKMCDIEEALEDAIGGGEKAREWWRKKGVDFNANDKEWTKLQTLN